MTANSEPIIVQEIFKTSVATLWKSITNVNEMRQWFFENIESFEAEVGFQTKFNVQSPERSFLHLWTITEVEPLKKIVYNWKYEGYSGNSFVYFELFEEKNRTKLRLTAKITEDFPTDIPEFKTENCQQGWEFFIKLRLKEFIEKNR